MYDELSDSQIDEHLRRVPLPPELTARLQEACLPDEVELDAALRRLNPPPGLVDRLQTVIEDEVFRLRIPTLNLMSKMNASIQ